MRRKISYQTLLPIYTAVLILFLLTGVFANKAIAVFSEMVPIQNRNCVILDAGHGGVDGGATSVSGVLESQINLEIAERLNDLFHLLGVETKMIRTTDCSVYTEGQTIAEKKVSDLKERVRVVNETENAFLLSIHQNYFTDERYSGPQVFYAKTQDSETVAKKLQENLIFSLKPQNRRQSKPCSGVYLMERIQCTGILLECGFLSNPREDRFLQSPEYQKKLSCVVATTITNFLNDKSDIA